MSNRPPPTPYKPIPEAKPCITQGCGKPRAPQRRICKECHSKNVARSRVEKEASLVEVGAAQAANDLKKQMEDLKKEVQQLAIKNAELNRELSGFHEWRDATATQIKSLQSECIKLRDGSDED